MLRYLLIDDIVLKIYQGSQIRVTTENEYHAVTLFLI